MQAYIDIGSNSVRLMLWEDGKTLLKNNMVTALAEGLAFSGILSQEAISRTVEQVLIYTKEAALRGAKKVFIFATEAVRSAVNGQEFCKKVLEKTGITVDVLDGETEAELAFYGAFNGGTCSVVDIGGASTEIIVGNKKRILYSKSVSIGVVKIKNISNEDPALLDGYISENLAKYGEIPASDKLIAIGGTAGTIAAITKKMSVYNPEKIHGTILSLEEIQCVADLLISTPLEKRCEIVGLPKNRASVLVGGAFLLANILKKLHFKECMVSELDNLEGYAAKFSQK